MCVSPGGQKKKKIRQTLGAAVAPSMPTVCDTQRCTCSHIHYILSLTTCTLLQIITGFVQPHRKAESKSSLTKKETKNIVYVVHLQAYMHVQRNVRNHLVLNVSSTLCTSALNCDQTYTHLHSCSLKILRPPHFRNVFSRTSAIWLAHIHHMSSSGVQIFPSSHPLTPL